jgi:hypothetical protein
MIKDEPGGGLCMKFLTKISLFHFTPYSKFAHITELLAKFISHYGD